MKLFNNTNIDTLIAGCKKGDRKCQQEVYRMFYGKMMSICLRYTNDKDDAKDVLQEGFIKAFSQLDKYNFNGSFEGWIRRIMVNNAIDFYRKNKHVYDLLDSDAEVENINVTDENEEQEENVFKNIKSNDIMEAIQTLTPAYRTVFNLYVMEGYSHQQIADELNINLGTSKSNLAKARFNLQKILKQKFISI